MKIENRRTVMNEQNGYEQELMTANGVDFIFDFSGLQDYPDATHGDLSRDMRSGYLHGRAKFGKKWAESTSFININDLDKKEVELWKMDFINKTINKIK